VCVRWESRYVWGLTGWGCSEALPNLPHKTSYLAFLGAMVNSVWKVLFPKRVSLAVIHELSKTILRDVS